jgi:hypothetical protein
MVCVCLESNGVDAEVAEANAENARRAIRKKEWRRKKPGMARKSGSELSHRRFSPQLLGAFLRLSPPFSAFLRALLRVLRGENALL